MAKCVMAGKLGINFDFDKIPANGVDETLKLMFSESQGRILATVCDKKLAEFETLFANLPYAIIGEVTETPALVGTKAGSEVLKADLEGLASSYKNTLDW